MEGVRSLDHQHICFHIQQQIMHGFDHLLLHHGEKVSVERRNLFLAAAARRLKVEEDEIGRKRCLSRALEERVHRLRVEAQMWRDVALSLEAISGALRCDLDRGLAAAAVGDTESACRPSDGAAEANRRMRKSACRSCRRWCCCRAGISACARRARRPPWLALFAAAAREPVSSRTCLTDILQFERDF